MERFAETAGVDLVTFERANGRTTSRSSTSPRSTDDEGVLFIGKAQEKASVFRTEKRRNADDGSTYRGSSARRRRSITTTSTSWTATSARCSSSSAPTFPTP